jgi:hypothetical protein
MMAHLVPFQACPALAKREALWQGSARSVQAFLADSLKEHAAVAQW